MSCRKLLPGLVVFTIAVVAIFSCSKKDNNPSPTPVTPVADFKTKKMLTYTDSSFLLTLPTAFTPNGDGVNDVYAPMGMHITNTNYSLTITTMAGTTVFQTNDHSVAWMGRNSSGAMQTDYKYNVAISFKTATGKIIDTSTYLYLVPTTTTCTKMVATDTAYYAFPDQLDMTTGLKTFATNEAICP